MLYWDGKPDLVLLVVVSLTRLVVPVKGEQKALSTSGVGRGLSIGWDSKLLVLCTGTRDSSLERKWVFPGDKVRLMKAEVMDKERHDRWIPVQF